MVHAKDMIPRLSLGSMEALVQEMVAAGAHVRLPKIVIMLRLWLLGHKPAPEAVFREPAALAPQQRTALERYAVEQQVRRGAAQRRLSLHMGMGVYMCVNVRINVCVGRGHCS